MIRLEKICSGIGSVDILHEIDLTVTPGELVVVLGANGAGKTTLLRTISGLVETFGGGTIEFDGQRIQHTRAHVLARTGLVHVPQGRQIIPSLTVEEKSDDRRRASSWSWSRRDLATYRKRVSSISRAQDTAPNSRRLPVRW